MKASYFNSDTIAAILTAGHAMAALGVIRVSGPEAWACAREILRSHKGEAFVPENIESHKLYRCVVKGKKSAAIDDGMFVWMKAPHSYTGEDVVELHLHGSPFLLRKVMHELLSFGAREALPGEFSFRAFQNGKITLDQAEAVADLISSKSEEGARLALSHLLGNPRQEVANLQKEVVNRLAEVELDIDFSDQGLSNFDHELWANRLEAWCEKVERMRRDYLRSQPLREGIRLALVGEPNSGKSSLFNRFLGENRSIVSQEAGTTRDVVSEVMAINGILFRFSDTAGLRAAQHEVEVEGIKRSYGEAGSAHLLLWVFDGANFHGNRIELEKQFEDIRKRVGDAQFVAAWNKSDLAPLPDAVWSRFFAEKNIRAIPVSAKSGEGIQALLDGITGLYLSTGEQKPDFWISRTRHFAVLGKAVEAVRAAIAKVKAGEKYPDLLAGDLRAALMLMGEITGDFTSEDLLHHIFSEFCIGK